MTVDLLQLASRFDENANRETGNVWLMTATPWVGDLAYFSVVYKPAPLSLVESSLGRLRAPDALYEFYQGYNGAHLFGGRLSIYGVVPEGQLLDRSDPYSLPPFNLERYQSGDSNFLSFGFYQADGSQVFLDRRTSEAVVLDGETREVVFHWEDFWAWLGGEFERFSVSFDQQGRLVGSDALIGPPRNSWT